VVGCPSTGEALLVDPKVGRRDAYAQVFDRFGLTLRQVVDTHTHADHLSDSAVFQKEGAALLMSRRTACQRKITRLGAGDEVAVGSLRFGVLEVPGHTVDSIALFGHGIVICGDTLFAGAVARSDFRGSDAASLFESIRDHLLTLPDDTAVLPGHDYRDLLFTTIGHERAHNPALQHPSGAAYAAAIADVEGASNTPEVDAMLAANLAANMEADPDLPDSGSAAVAACSAGTESAGVIDRPREKLPAELAADREALTAAGAWIDVRDPWEFAESHIPGTRSAPLGELCFHLDALRTRAPSVISCLGGVRSITVARTLAYLGVATDAISMKGGLRLWQDQGLPIQAAPLHDGKMS